MTAERYEVQTRHLGGDWQNTWSEDDQPQTFASTADALLAINEHIGECERAVQAGDMDDAPSADDFRIVPVQQPDGGHTPGPWAVSLSNHNPPTIYRESDGKDLAYLRTITDSGLQELANARLIAAAPDLLAALRAALANEQEHGQDWQPWADAAQDAIRKAMNGG